MKGLAACFRPSLRALKQPRAHLNTVRAYGDNSNAGRLYGLRAISRAQLQKFKIRNICSPNTYQLKSVSGLSPTPVLAESQNSSPKHHGLDHQWPRFSKGDAVASSCREFHEEYNSVLPGQTELEEIQVRGRIWAFRIAGNKLAFVDLVQDNVKLQIVCNFQELEKRGVGREEFEQFLSTLKRGDIIGVVGHPHRTPRNELSLLSSDIPRLLSPSIRPLPMELKNEESRIRFRHLDLLLRPQAAQILKLGSEIKKFLRNYLENEGHVSVRTPILADAAGGAVAKPFYTKGFEGRNMALRIAPELWLKRLIIGGFERVYEIGPSFRNEGIDLSHNPEFETCEFYRTYADLDELIHVTEDLLHQMSTVVNVIQDIDFSPSYVRLDFIPAIEAELGCKLPPLSATDVDPVPIITKSMQDRSIGIPESPTLPRLLDKLCSHYLEPRCQAPTWIINHPECLSPLSKSFKHETTGQIVSARAELFVHKQEIVNTYEEENSPIAQREKFIAQLKFNHAEDIEGKLDESYLEALEYGMPPTGGWGCGIERLTMLFGGTKRIADTLAFGTLKNVVALGSHERTPLHSQEKTTIDGAENTVGNAG